MMWKKGFGLVETILVLGFISVAVVATLVGYNAYQHKAKIQNEVSLINQLNTNMNNIFSVVDVTSNHIALGSGFIEDVLPEGMSMETNKYSSVNNVVNDSGGIYIEVGPPTSGSFAGLRISSERVETAVFILNYVDLKEDYCVDLVQKTAPIFSFVYAGSFSEELKNEDFDVPLQTTKMVEACSGGSSIVFANYL